MKNTALITGASGGIGKELAYLHAETGSDLILIARSEEKLINIKKELEEKFNIKVMLIIKDLTEKDAVKEVYTEIKEAGIQVEYLMNNAGFGGHGKFHERDWNDEMRMIQLNIVALTEMTKLFVQDMIKRDSGKILNVSSTAALLPGPMQAVYFATKAYVTSFSNALSGELFDTKVTVTALMPGATETDFASIAGMSNSKLFKNAASAKTVAKDGYIAMMKGKLDVISGLKTTEKIMMAALPFTPKKMILDQIRRMQSEN